MVDDGKTFCLEDEMEGNGIHLSESPCLDPVAPPSPASGTHRFSRDFLLHHALPDRTSPVIESSMLPNAPPPPPPLPPNLSTYPMFPPLPPIPSSSLSSSILPDTNESDETRSEEISSESSCTPLPLFPRRFFLHTNLDPRGEIRSEDGEFVA